MRGGGRLAQCRGLQGGVDGEDGEVERGRGHGGVTLTPTLTLSETKGKGSGEGAETSLDLNFSQVPPLRIHFFDQTKLPLPAQTLQPLLPTYGR
jgi:hypothetical protein